MDKIPQDIFIEILSRLTLKSLAGFKIVSKEWHYVITNLVPVADNPMAIVCRHPRNAISSLHCINHRGDEEIVSFPIVRKWYDRLKIHSSCKGLLLVQFHCDLFVWNPLTKFIKKVLICDALKNADYWGIAGLCYDNVVNKYKVVVATHELSFIDQAFLVGTCGSDKLEHYSFRSKIKEAKSGPYFREHIHWYYRTEFNSRVQSPPQQIAYFDPKENQFIELPTPQPKDGILDEITGLGVIDGCLSITRSSIHRIFQNRLELLAMKEYGVGNSWEIVLIISDQICLPCGFAVPVCKQRDSGEMVCIFSMDKWGMRVYDANGNVIVRPIYQLENSSLVAYDECVTSPVDQLYWENVEKNLCSDSPFSVCSSTCALSHICAWHHLQE